MNQTPFAVTSGGANEVPDLVCRDGTHPAWIAEGMVLLAAEAATDMRVPRSTELMSTDLPPENLPEVRETRFP